MDLLNTFTILFFIYFFYSWYQKVKKIHFKQLNGPNPIPILGNLHQLSKYGLPHHTLTEYHKFYGPIYRVFFGDVYTVIVSDPKLIREMCIDNHEIIGKNRPVTPIFLHCQKSLGVATSNIQWERNREILNNAMKKQSTKKVYDLLNYQVEQLIKSMKKFESSGEPFEINLYAHRFSLATMYKYIFNEDIPYDEDITKSKFVKFVRPLDEIVKLLSAGNLGDYINILRPFYNQYLKYSEKNVKIIKDFLCEKYDEHLSTIDYNNPRDFLDIIIKDYKENESGKSDQYIKDSIVAVGFDLFLAGSDTSANSIEWFVLRMCNNQEIQDKAYDELKNIAGDRNIKLSDRPSTPFLNSILKETLRRNPVSGFGLPKYCTSDIMIGDHFIPKNSQILINYKGLSYNEEYFSNPNEFNPLRFLNRSSDGYMPFSVGERSCGGISLASDELYLAFSNLILNFKMTSIDGNIIDDTEVWGLTLKPNPFKIILKSR